MIARARVNPEPESEHLLCPTCGQVRILPLEPGEEAPWCIHTNLQSFRWSRPAGASERWTQMIPVAIEAIALAPGELVGRALEPIVKPDPGAHG